MTHDDHLCDLCRQETHIGNRIVVDWDGSYVRTCRICLNALGQCAIECSQGSLEAARRIAAERITHPAGI